MVIKSQFNVPDKTNGYNIHHFETETSQIADMTSLVQTISTTGNTAAIIRELLDINYLFRKENTTYTLGDVVYASALGTCKKLVCVRAGTSDTADLTISSLDEGTLIIDGTVTWIIDSLADGIYNAAHQNSDYRGADLTAYWDSGLMSANIQAGIFVGMHIGDYIKKSITVNGTTYDKDTFNDTGFKWLLAGFDLHLACGYINDASVNYGTTTAHHVCIIPDTTLQRNVYMNSSNTTSGGYMGSYMWKTVIPQWTTGITNAFGSSHILTYYDYLTNSVSGNAANNGVWTSVTVNIPSESMVYGKHHAATNTGDDYVTFPRQWPLFALKCNHIWDIDQKRSWFWLRDVVSSSHFADADSGGSAGNLGASSAYSSGGLRPYSLLR